MKRFCLAPVKILLILISLTACSTAPEQTANPLTTATPQPSPTPTIALVEPISDFVVFPSSDGNTLIRGVLYGQNPIGVILTHSGATGANRGDWASFAEMLASYGYMVLIYDIQGYGSTPGRAYSIRSGVISLEGAVAFMREQGTEELILIGAGNPGMVGIELAAANESDDIVGMAAISSPQTSYDNVLEVTDEELAALTMPTLWVSSRDDERAEDMEAMYDGAAGPDKELQIYPGDLRGTDIFQNAEYGADLEQRLLDFVLRAAYPGG
jgi:pimeloyl-ACP methyl ester carboxylesterase